MFPESSEQPELTGRARTGLSVLLQYHPFCQMPDTQQAGSRATWRGEPVMAEDVAQLAWLTQTKLGY